MTDLHMSFLLIPLSLGACVSLALFLDCILVHLQYHYNLYFNFEIASKKILVLISFIAQ